MTNKLIDFVELLTELSLVDSSIEPGDDAPPALQDRIMHALEALIDEGLDQLADSPDEYFLSFRPDQLVEIRDLFRDSVLAHGIG